MCKIVILSSDMEIIKFLCNCIINQFSGVQLSGIGTTMEEFDSLVANIKPNIIIMDYSNYINSKYCNKLEYKKSKIIFCNSTPTSKNSSTQLFVLKNAKPNEIIKPISDFISKHDKKLLRKKIIKLLETFKFDFKLIGTTYILESILYCYENKTDYVFENLEKNVYPYIANLCHTSVEKVKWAISRAINIVNSRVSISTQKQLSNNLTWDPAEKATAKQLINVIVTKLS